MCLYLYESYHIEHFFFFLFHKGDKEYENMRRQKTLPQCVWFAALSASLLSSFKHLIGGLDDVSNKGYEDAEAKAK